MPLLDGDDFIVKCWPRLENLCLGAGNFWKTRPKITFQGIVSILSFRLNLKELGLMFDAAMSSSPMTEKQARRWDLQHKYH